MILRSSEGSIQAQNLGGEGEENNVISPVLLRAPKGDIVVSTINYFDNSLIDSIDDFSTLISIEAGGIFRATGAFLSRRRAVEEGRTTINEKISIFASPGIAEVNIQHGGSSFNISSEPVLNEDGSIQYREILSENEPFEPPSLGEIVFPKDGDPDTFERANRDVVEEVVAVYEPIPSSGPTASFTEGAISIGDSNGGISASYRNVALTGAGSESIGDDIKITSTFEPPLTELPPTEPLPAEPPSNQPQPTEQLPPDKSDESIPDDGEPNQPLPTDEIRARGDRDFNENSAGNTPDNSNSENNNNSATNNGDRTENEDENTGNNAEEHSNGDSDLEGEEFPNSHEDSDEDNNRELDRGDDSEEDRSGCEAFDSGGILDASGISPEECKE